MGDRLPSRTPISVQAVALNCKMQTNPQANSKIL